MKCVAGLLLAAFSIPAIAGGTDWPTALKGVSAGDAHWIEQIPALAAVANVTQAQQLEDALAASLTTNTNATLKALRKIDAGKWPHMIGSDIVCTPQQRSHQQKSTRSISAHARRCWKLSMVHSVSGYSRHVN